MYVSVCVYLKCMCVATFVSLHIHVIACLDDESLIGESSPLLKKREMLIFYQQSATAYTYKDFVCVCVFEVHVCTFDHCIYMLLLSQSIVKENTTLTTVQHKNKLCPKNAQPMLFFVGHILPSLYTKNNDHLCTLLLVRREI